MYFRYVLEFDTSTRAQRLTASKVSTERAFKPLIDLGFYSILEASVPCCTEESVFERLPLFELTRLEKLELLA